MYDILTEDQEDIGMEYDKVFNSTNIPDAKRIHRLSYLEGRATEVCIIRGKLAMRINIPKNVKRKKKP